MTFRVHPPTHTHNAHNCTLHAHNTRRWVGTAVLAIPMVAAHVWHGSPAAGAAIAAGGRLVSALGGGWGPPPASLQWLFDLASSGGGAGVGPGILPTDAVVHITVAWAVGGLMAYLTDWYRR